jgi:hypothetical protein
MELLCVSLFERVAELEKRVAELGNPAQPKPNKGQRGRPPKDRRLSRVSPPSG